VDVGGQGVSSSGRRLYACGRVKQPAPAGYAAAAMSEPALPVAFLSDYGLVDEFVGVVHGVVARIAPEVHVLDVTHQIPRGDVRAGALALLRAVQYLPPGVALAVVDPGVGTGRRGIAASTPWGYFVGPDNGLLAPAVAVVGGAERVVSLEDPRFRLPSEGATFDGRDVFAPAAAVLGASRATLDDLGPDVAAESIVPLLLPLADLGEDVVRGEVWWVDGFGNAETNVAPDDLRTLGLDVGDVVAVEIGRAVHEMEWRDGYGELEGFGVVNIDSYGMVAVAVPGGRADEVFGLSTGVHIGFRRPSG